MLSDDNDSKKLWKFIKSRKTDTIGISPLTNAGIAYSDSQAKSDILNEQFCSVFTVEDPNIPSLGVSKYPDMPEIIVSIAGVRTLLRKLNPGKASGPDNISGYLLKPLADELAPALVLLFNKSLQTGEIPSIWKHALVQPLFKKGDRSRAANYRPISLTCICCKMLEHIIRREITIHLENQDILADAQHGFRQKRSCETQLLLTVDELASNIDAGSQTDIILLDFSKAFDKVPHQRLLAKLDYYGIRGRSHAWIRSFLGDRSQQVVVESKTSYTGAVISGVPQGSVLGPTLFLVYINDLCDNLNSTVRLFADDTSLCEKISTVSDADRLQSDLDKLCEWERKWQMDFNVEKCNSLTVTLRKNPIIYNYQLNGQTLERVDSAKYLGVTLVRSLNWSKHTSTIAATANKTSAFIHRNLKGCPRKIQTQCYKSLVRPILEYASTVWCPYQKDAIAKLEMVQRRTAHRINRDFSRETSASQLFTQLDLDTLKSRRDISKATMMYRIMNGIVDVKPIVGTITPSARQTRVQHRLMVPHTRTNVRLHSFFPSAIRIWNSLPEAAASAPSIETFKTAMKGWCLDE